MYISSNTLASGNTARFDCVLSNENEIGIHVSHICGSAYVAISRDEAQSLVNKLKTILEETVKNGDKKE